MKGSKITGPGRYLPKPTVTGEIERNFESTRVQDARRFMDEPAPTEDEQISKYQLILICLENHYLKHHPFYEFKNFDDLTVNPYKYWLHGRADYFQSETYPGELSAWEMGSKFNHMVYLLFPVFAFTFFGKQYRKHCKHKNLKMPIVGVFSQHAV